MLALFNRHRSRFARPIRSRRNRVVTAGITPERLEQRIALDAAGGRELLLQQTSTLVMDQSMGPNPVVMSMQQVAGTDVKSFVISHVPDGSSVEKWDAATESWIDVSTMPSSSQPQQLMQFLANRTIHQGDKIQWRPKAGFEGPAQQAFQMINWDDGSELLAPNLDVVPSAVRNLAVTPTGVGKLTLTWNAPIRGDATSYSITMTTTDVTGSTSVSVYPTATTSYELSGLSPTSVYAFSVTASNAEATGPSSSVAFNSGINIEAPSAPQSLASVFGPGQEQMTFSWQPPASDGGSLVLSYTASVFQGDCTETITTQDLSSVFSGLTLGSGPTYFTATATNFAGVSDTAALQIDAYGNPIPAEPSTGIGISTDSVGTTFGGFDGAGNTYSWTALGDTSSGGALVGNTLVSGGLAFHVNPNQPDFTWAAGQDIEATGSGNVLTLAAAAVNGSQANQHLTLNFTDGTSITWTQSFSDWCSRQFYKNESQLSTQSYRNTASGGTNAITNYIYSYGYTLPEGKTLESITLPNNANVCILGAVLSEPTAVDLSWNAYGIVVGNNQVPNSQGFDGDGNYYNAYNGNVVGHSLGRLASSNSNFDYMQITWGGATFDLGAAPNHYSQSNNRNGNNNFLQARGQTISLPAGDFSQLLLIGAAANGDQLGTITLHFAGESSGIPWTQAFADWMNSSPLIEAEKDFIKVSPTPASMASTYTMQPPSGSALAASGESLVAVTNVVNQVGNNQNDNAYVYGYSFDLTPYAGMTLESITLPNNSNIGILGMALI